MVNSPSLREKFNHCGIIKDVFCITPKNCAVLWFDSEDAVELALAMDKTLLGDRLIYVQTVDTEKAKVCYFDSLVSKPSLLQKARLHIMQKRFFNLLVLIYLLIW